MTGRLAKVASDANRPVTDATMWPADEVRRRADEFLGRWREGDEPRLEDYLKNVPQDQYDRLLGELLKLDVAARTVAARTVTLEEYLVRFPNAEPLIRSAFEEQKVPTSGTEEQASLPAPLAPGQVFGNYTLTHRIGVGGMGEVYAARQARLERKVAIKFINSQLQWDPESKSRFERETRILGNLEHPNLVRAYDAAEINGWTFLVMELVEGMDLADLIVRRGPLGVREACAVIQQAAQGLAKAHEQSIIHRDVKPSNLMLTHDGTVKVLDLGLARPMGADDGLTVSGMMMGTADYIAPEQAESAAEVTGAADVYSLGATLFSLLVGRAPFDTGAPRTLFEKIEAHRTHPVPKLSDYSVEVPELLEKLIRKMMAKKPTSRPSADDLARWLTRFSKGAQLEGAIPQIADDATIPPKATPTPKPVVQPDGQATVKGYKTPPPQAGSQPPKKRSTQRRRKPTSNGARPVHKKKATRAKQTNRFASFLRSPLGIIVVLIGSITASVVVTLAMLRPGESADNTVAQTDDAENQGSSAAQEQAKAPANEKDQAVAKLSVNLELPIPPPGGENDSTRKGLPSFPPPPPFAPPGAQPSSQESESSTTDTELEPFPITLTYKTRYNREPQLVGKLRVPPIGLDDEFQLQVRLPQEAYLYLVVVLPNGKVRPLYPSSDNQGSRSAESQEKRTHFDIDASLRMGEPLPDPGVWMLLALTSDEPRDAQELESLLSEKMKSFPSHHIQGLAAAWFVDGKLTAGGDKYTHGAKSPPNLLDPSTVQRLSDFEKLLEGLPIPGVRTFALAIDPERPDRRGGDDRPRGAGPPGPGGPRPPGRGGPGRPPPPRR